MTDSIFTKIFSYRQRENHSPLENFLTEIFAYCLQTDSLFREDFFTSCLNIQLEKLVDINIKTQEEYEGFGRPDIEVNYKETTILFECKVEANERFNQLEDYASILNKHKLKTKKKHIVFLTRYFEHKEITDKNIRLHLLRWYSVFEIISERHLQITNELKKFLKEQGMEKIKNFTIQDLLAMKIIPETITKMDELLEQFKPEFDKQFGGFSRDASRSTRLPNSLYINYVQLNFDKASYYILIGFFWWWSEQEIPDIGISLEIPIKKFEHSELITILDKELVENNEWDFQEDGKNYYYSASKPLTEFITNEDDNISAMKKFLQEKLNILYQVRTKYPELLKK